jgi:hypothetical protein
MLDARLSGSFPFFWKCAERGEDSLDCGFFGLSRRQESILALGRQGLDGD